MGNKNEKQPRYKYNCIISDLIQMLTYITICSFEWYSPLTTQREIFKYIVLDLRTLVLWYQLSQY